MFGLSGPRSPALISSPRPPTSGPFISFNKLNVLLVKVQPRWSCAHYFQRFTCYLNHIDLLCLKKTTLLFNVHLSCFADFIQCPTDEYMFKVNNKKIWLICWICSKLKLNTAWHHPGVFIVDFGHSQHINIVLLLLTLNKYLSTACRKQVIMF